MQLGERAVRPGDEVITVAAGFPTVNPIIQNGAISGSSWTPACPATTSM